MKSGMDPGDAREIAQEEARDIARDEARVIAGDRLQAESFELVRDICDRHGVQMAAD